MSTGICGVCRGSGIVAGLNEYETMRCENCGGTGDRPKPVVHPVVYVAGPFRAPTPWLVELNVRKAEEISSRLWAAGVTNICPHLLGRFFDKHIPDPVILAGTLEIMARCDAIVLVPGWKDSSGTAAELYHMTQVLLRPAFGVTEPVDIAAVAAWARQRAS